MYDSESNTTRTYWRSFDYIKGVLILFVFMGHIIPGVLRDIYPRYIIYSFHMPMFIGISGFLLNIEKLNMRFSSLTRKYWKRLVCPWVTAVIVFYFITNIKNIDNISVKSFLSSFVRPYYHLWYVLGFLSYLICASILWCVFKNNNRKWIWIFIFAIVISCISEFGLLKCVMNQGILGKIYSCVHKDFRLYNFIFFIAGVYLRYRYENRLFIKKKTVESVRIIAIMSIMIVSVLFFFDYQNIERIMYYIMNIPLLLVLISDCINSKMPESRVVEFLGKFSLPIYLYHVLCKIAASHLCGSGTILYYLLCIILLVIECILIFYLRRIKLINNIVFGSTNTSR